MYEINAVYSALEKLAPLSLAEEWDNPGLLVDCAQPVTGVLCALDITPPVVREAKQRGCNLIVAHHPVIFHPLKRITAQDAAFMLVQSNISAICMHTNLDAAEGGVNDVLASALGLTDVRVMPPIGRIGTLPAEMTAKQLAQLCARVLQADVCVTEDEKPVRTVAVVGGSGGDFAAQAAAEGADCLVTGEAGHHDALEARALGIALITAGHYGTERPIADALRAYLAREMPDLPVFTAQAEQAPLHALREEDSKC